MVDDYRTSRNGKGNPITAWQAGHHGKLSGQSKDASTEGFVLGPFPLPDCRYGLPPVCSPWLWAIRQSRTATAAR